MVMTSSTLDVEACLSADDCAGFTDGPIRGDRYITHELYILLGSVHSTAHGNLGYRKERERERESACVRARARQGTLHTVSKPLIWNSLSWIWRMTQLHGELLLRCLVTGDETWVSHMEPKARKHP
jgi:hypothetical protein